MPEHRHRAHVGNFIVSGDPEGIRYLQALSSQGSRSMFDHASEGGEAYFSHKEVSYALRRNPDYTFTVHPAQEHRAFPT